MKLESLSKLIIFCIICLILLPISVGESGNVWAVHADRSRNDIFDLNEIVYFEGQNFDKHVYFTWKITDQDSLGTDAEKEVVAYGDGYTNDDGIIGPLFYTGYNIPSDVYPINFKLRVTIHPTGEVSEDDFTKKDSFESIPEFPTIALPVAMILSLMFIFASRKEE